MIKVSDYNHRLYEITKEGKFGKWTLKKILYKKGSDIVCYKPEWAYIYKDQPDEDWKGVELKDEFGVMMTDNIFEQESYKDALEFAHGSVLVCGLGIGFFNVMVEEKIKKGIISKLTIVEIDRDLVNWVTDYIPMKNTHIIVSDAREYLEKTGEKYDFIFIDIWPSDRGASLEGPVLAGKAKRHLNPGGTVRYWMEGKPA